MPTKQKTYSQSKAPSNDNGKTIQRISTIQTPTEKQLNPVEIVQRVRMSPNSLTRNDVMQLQSTIGNRAVIQLLSELQDNQKSQIGENPVQLKDGGKENLQSSKGDKTGMPHNLKSGLEALSGLDMSDVRVHHNSDKPQQVGALAYTQGNDIHVAPGQEKHLPHEGWHVVQQKQGRVKPIIQMKTGVYVNDDSGLEKEADIMGMRVAENGNMQHKSSQTMQLKWDEKKVMQKAPKADKDNDLPNDFDKLKTPTSYKGVSIVDYLKSIGVDSSKGNCAKIAKYFKIVNDVNDYKGTAQQNSDILAALRSYSKSKDTQTKDDTPKIEPDKPKTDEEKGKGSVDIATLKDRISKYVDFKLTDSSGKVSSKIQLPYQWGDAGGIGKWSLEEINKNMTKLGLNSNDPKLQSEVTANSTKTGIDCSGFVLQVMNAATNGMAAEYYKKKNNIPDDNVLHWGVTADDMTSPKYSTKIQNLADVRPGDYIRFAKGTHIGIVYDVSGDTIEYAHSSSGKGPHMASVKVSEEGKSGLNLVKYGTFSDWDPTYSNTIRSLFNYICRANFASYEEKKDPEPKPESKDSPEKPADKKVSENSGTIKAKYGQSSEFIRQVQELLIKGGWWTEPSQKATGNYRDITKASIEVFQRYCQKEWNNLNQARSQGAPDEIYTGKMHLSGIQVSGEKLDEATYNALKIEAERNAAYANVDKDSTKNSSGGKENGTSKDSKPKAGKGKIIYEKGVDEKFVKQYYSSYMDKLQELVDGNGWQISFYSPGIDWKTFIDIEFTDKTNEEGKSLTPDKNQAIPNSEKFEGGDWYNAKRSVIEYFADPRNFILNETDIFQFLSLDGYNADTQTEQGVKNILTGTALEKYSYTFIKAAESAQINVYYLASKCKQETTKGTCLLFTGKVPDYDIPGYGKFENYGYHNAYSINAYTTKADRKAGMTQVQSINKNGAQYAKAKGWTSEELAITGGAQWCKDQYISMGQDTMYGNKFDLVAAGGYGQHQYVQNIQASKDEASRYYKAYKSINAIKANHLFRIPVFKNMPAKPVELKK